MNKTDLRIKDTTNFVFIELGGKRRQLYTLLFIILLLTMFVGMDMDYDFSEKRIAGTIFFFIILIVTFGVALYHKVYILNKGKKELIVRSSVMKKFFVFSEKRYSFENGIGFRVRNLQDFPSYTKNEKLKKVLEGKKSLYGLYVLIDKDVIPICSSKDKLELDSICHYLQILIR